MNTEPSEQEEAPESIWAVRTSNGAWVQTWPAYAKENGGVEYIRADLAKNGNEWKEFAEECKEGIRASHRTLDEFGVPREDAWLQETDGKSYGIEEVVEYPVHERIKMLPPFAATRMREACVDELRGRLRDPSLTFSNEGIKAAVIDWTNMLIRRLESLTLDQVEGKQ